MCSNCQSPVEAQGAQSPWSVEVETGDRFTLSVIDGEVDAALLLRVAHLTFLGLGKKGFKVAGHVKVTSIRGRLAHVILMFVVLSHIFA